MVGSTHKVLKKQRVEVKPKMTSIKEQAKAYEPQQTKNISELDQVSVNLELQTETYKEGTPDEFSVNVTEIDGEKYRVPVSVLAQLKEILEEKPEMEYFKVRRSGEGMNTKYTVIAL